MTPSDRWRYLLLPVPALVVLLGLEAGLRVRHERIRDRLVAMDPTRPLCTRPASDPVLLYEVTPGRCGANSRGFLDEEHAVPGPPGRRRIVVIGDSVAAGERVGRSNAFPMVLARMLNGGRQPPPYEVVLLTRSGYSMEQELRLLETEAPRYEPVALVWSYVLNDPADPTYHDPNGSLGVYHHAPASHLADFVGHRLFLMREEWRARGCRNEYHARLHCVYGREVDGHIRRIGAWSVAQRVPVVFVIHPVFERDGRFDDYSLAGVHADLAGMAELAGLQVVDVLEAYRGRRAADLKVADSGTAFDPWHPNVEGHRLAAEMLARRMKAAGLVQD